jgi:hypothetical protein
MKIQLAGAAQPAVGQFKAAKRNGAVAQAEVVQVADLAVTPEEVPFLAVRVVGLVEELHQVRPTPTAAQAVRQTPTAQAAAEQVARQEQTEPQARKAPQPAQEVVVVVVGTATA